MKNIQLPCAQGIAEQGRYFTNSYDESAQVVPFSYGANPDSNDRVCSFINVGPRGGKLVYPHFFTFYLESTPPTSATSMQYFVYLDKYRATTTASAVLGSRFPTSSNHGSIGKGSIRLNYPVVGASRQSRLISRGVMRSTIPVVEDEWTFVFGSRWRAHGGLLGGTTPQQIVIPLPPVVVAPGWESFISVFFPATIINASKIRFTAGWWER